MDMTTNMHEPAGGRSVRARSVVDYVLSVLRKRLLTLVLIALGVFALGVGAVMLMTPKFVAIARIKIDPNQNAMIGVDQPKTGSPDQNLIETEVSVLQSRAIAEVVVETLKLANDPEFAPPRAADGGTVELAAAQRQATAVRNVLKNLKVGREKMTYVVDIAFTSIDADKAARIANAFVTAYMNNSVGSRSGTAARQAEFLRKRLAVAGAELNKSEMQAASYRASAGIMGSGMNGSYAGTVTDQQIASLSAQLATAESSASAAQSKLGVARSQMQTGGLDAVSAVLESPVVTDLRRQRAEVVRDMGNVQARYGPKHPESVKVAQQIQQLDNQIDQEARRVIGGLTSEASASAAAANSLRAQMGQLRGVQQSNTRAGVLAQGAQQQADAKRDTYNRLAQAAQQAQQLATNTQTQAQVIEVASAPMRPASPNKPMLMALSLMVAMVAGVGTIGVQEMLSRGLKTSDEIERELGIPVIGSLPRLAGAQLTVDGVQRSPADVLVAKPVTQYAESFRVIRSALQHLQTGRRGKVVALVSSLPDEGKTTSVASLARVFAMSGEKVLVIDCDLRKAGLSELTGQSGGDAPGIVEVLHGDATLADAARKDIVDRLDILPVASATFTAEDLFGGDAMRALLAEATQRYDRVIIDTPPLLGVADARTLSAMADSVVLVVRWNSTPIDALRDAMSSLDLNEAPVAGAIFNMVDPKSEALGVLYYSRKYSAYYEKA